MSSMNGNMSDRDLNEISILLGLKKLNSCEKEGFIKDFEKVLNLDEFKMMNMNGLEMMSSSEVEKLKMGIDGLLKMKKYKLGMILRSKLRILREEVKEIMWDYFKKNRLNLSDDIGEFREDIIVDLIFYIEIVERCLEVVCAGEGYGADEPVVALITRVSGEACYRGIGSHRYDELACRAGGRLPVFQ